MTVWRFHLYSPKFSSTFLAGGSIMLQQSVDELQKVREGKRPFSLQWAGFKSTKSSRLEGEEMCYCSSLE